jgi:Rrf2 family protein
MKLTTMCRYAVSAMIDLVSSNIMSAVEISKRQQIPLPYLEQLLLKLKKNGLIKSIKGRNGGYLLSKQPSEISVNDIFQAVQGRLTIVDCLVFSDVCSKNAKCKTKAFWEKLNGRIENTLKSTTLLDLKEEKL